MLRAVTFAAGLLVGLPACSADGFLPPPLERHGEETVTWCRPLPDDIDILFVIDDSPSMAARQLWLAETLRNLHYGQVQTPMSARIAFTTTDMGNPACDPASRKNGALLLSSCRERLDDFVIGEGFEAGPADTRDVCVDRCPLERIETRPTTIVGDDTPRPRPWVEIEHRPSGTTTNLADGSDPVDALACAAMRGHAGCEHEAPIDAVQRALQRMHDPTDPAYGFLRRDAHLVIAVVTDEDDCSVRDASAFDPEGARTLWPDPDAERPPSAVCMHAGVDCSGSDDALACSPVDRDAEGHITTDPARAVLRPIDGAHAVLASIAANKEADRWVGIELVAGLTPSRTLEVSRGEGPFAEEHGTLPICESTHGPAAPPIRLMHWMEAWTEHPVVSSVCHEEGLLHSAGPRWPGGIRPNCFPACVADDEPERDGLQPSCTVTEVERDGTRHRLPPCLESTDGFDPPAGAHACWVASTGADMDVECVDEGWNLELQLYAGPEGWSRGGCIETTCEVSDRPHVDCPSLP